MLRILCLSFVLATALAIQTHRLNGYTFEQFKADHHKHYSTAEEHEMRRDLFEKELKKVNEHNAKKLSWTQTINKFSDMTVEEKRQFRGLSYKNSIDKSAGMKFEVDPNFKIPDSVDWRQNTPSVVTDVKDQGQCGSCWTFAAASVLESHFALYGGNNELPVLSTQNILDCTANPNQCGGTGGCEGGTAQLAIEAMKTYGITSEWQYPYQSYFGQDWLPNCRNQRSSQVVKVTGHVNLPSNQYEPLMQAVASVGPIAISVDAGSWSSYNGGVFAGCNNTSPTIDHAVVLVGYGTDNGTPYWLVRNSWSPAWGENGYIRILRHPVDQPCGTDTQPGQGTACKDGPATVTCCGECGILYDSCYPVVSAP